MKSSNKSKILVPKWWIQLIDNIRNRWKTFKVIEVEEFSDEWFLTEMRKRNPKGTICETHRQIFREVNSLYEFWGKNRVLQLIKKAYIQGQKMDDKLKEYKVFMND